MMMVDDEEPAPTIVASAVSSRPDWSFVQSAACDHRPPSMGGNLLGEGGGSVGVYKLVSPVTHDAYGVKVVRRDQPADAMRNFVREVEIFNKLRHPGICRLCTMVADTRFFLLVIELCEAGDLFGVVVKSQTGLAEEDARSYFVQIISAVDYCHSHGVYHRDMKLENVLITEGGRTTKITDFGFAKDTGLHSMPKTRDIGTRAYMPPEMLDTQADGTSYDGAAVDIWSLGVMLYVMVAVRYPFGDNKSRELIENIRNVRYSFPERSEGAICNRHLRELLAAMLVADPRDRITIADIRRMQWLAEGGGLDGGMELDELPTLVLDPSLLPPLLVEPQASNDSEFDYDEGHEQF